MNGVIGPLDDGLGVSSSCRSIVSQPGTGRQVWLAGANRPHYSFPLVPVIRLGRGLEKIEKSREFFRQRRE